MAGKLVKQCTETCKEQCEFGLKIVIHKLTLCDKEKDRGFEDIALVFTLDSNVFKIDNIKSEDENINIERNIFYQTTPELLSLKLKKSPIFINLVRECVDLGTIRLVLTDCFCEAVLCNEFSTESMTSEFKFIKDSNINANMEITIQVSRTPVDNDAMKDFLRANSKRRERQKMKKRVAADESELSSSSNDGLSSFMCDADLLKLCQLEEQTNSPSTKSKSSKCRSDIAASLDVNAFSEDQKTFCHGCRGYSVSGITCMNKRLLSKSSSVESKNDDCKSHLTINKSKKCSTPVNRICSECFVDLTVLPKNVPCPNCVCKVKTFKFEQNSEKRDNKACGDAQPNYFDKILNKILINDEKTSKKSSINQLDRIRSVKKKNVRQNYSNRHSVYLPRCSKVRKANETAAKLRTKKSLRVKQHGVVLGHQQCNHDRMLVPKNMGWLWNVENPGISQFRRGWKPGAVPKSVARMMKYFLHGESTPCTNKEDKIYENLSSTLKVEKKSGEYKITLNPTNDKSCRDAKTPIVFKISKTDGERKRWDVIKLLKSRGIKKICECNNISECSCINDCQKQIILYELKAISDVMCINPLLKYEELNEGSECSEIDFEFTPPFEMMNKCRRDVRVSVAETQYEEQPLDEKFEETEESSEEEILVVKKKKKIGKKKTNKKKDDKLQKSRNQTAPMILREIKPKCVSYCRPNIRTQCDFADRSTTNYNPLYLRCLPNYMTCPPRSTCCRSYPSNYNTNCGYFF